MNPNPAVRARARLAVLAACGLAVSTVALAQSTSGMVFGHAPAGDTVVAHSDSTGIQRRIHVPADGRYALRALPAGVYTVTLEEGGRAVVRHPKVPVRVGRGIEVDFHCLQGECAKAADRS